MRLMPLLSTCLAAGLIAAAAPAAAATVTDATGDFLPGYTGARLGDLDVTSFSVDFDTAAAQFVLGATFAGAITPSTEGLYVIGVNTGRGAIAPFGAIGQSNVTFDQAIVLNKNGTGTIGATALDPALIAITGNSFTARVAASLLPSTGRQPIDYGFNLWPRTGFTSSAQISDFSPENGLLAAVPEPEGWAMMLTGFFIVGAVTRRRTAVRFRPA